VSDLGAGRHHARARALEILYEADIKGRPASRVLSELAVAPDPYAEALVRAAEEHRARAEDLIGRHSIGWPLERLAVVDRLVMTLAVGELLTDHAPPTAVILDEAVELAKEYSTDASASFVNGVLSSIVDELAERS
jgi:N utilization substance protein B